MIICFPHNMPPLQIEMPGLNKPPVNTSFTKKGKKKTDLCEVVKHIMFLFFLYRGFITNTFKGRYPYGANLLFVVGRHP